MKTRFCTLALTVALMVSGVRALNIGDAAPDLTVAKFVKGAEVKASLKDSGMITVVEFWATWCGPCRESIPHLTKLQAQYKEKKVQIIGISDEEEAQVRPFVEGQGKDMDYTVAIDGSNKTWEAYAKPFGVEGIPHAFVVDATGTLLWHGNPMDGLDEVLAMTVEGTFDAAKARERATKDAMQMELGELTMLWAQEYLVLARYGRDKAAADAVGKRLLECGLDDATFFSQLAWTLLNSEGLAYENKEFMLQVAKFANDLAKGESADVMDTLAFALFKSGQVEQAVAMQKRAIELCDNDELLVMLKNRLTQYEGQ